MAIVVDLRCNSKRYAYALFVLTVLFTFRVVAQLVQAWHHVEFLPPFEAWHSGALPYEWLVGVQGVILAVCLRIVGRVFKGTIAPSRSKGKILFTLGSIYLITMCARLIVGLTIAPNHYWFGATLPIVFHLVLASFVILCGRFHCLAFQLEPCLPQWQMQ